MSDNINLVRDMARQSTYVACSTISHKTGAPFISSLMMGTDSAGAPIFLSSDLSKHAQNFKTDCRVSILVQSPSTANTDQDFPRASFIGQMKPLSDELAINRYLRRYPKGREFHALGDFHFYYLEIEKIYLVGGFASVANLSASQYLCEPLLDTIEGEAIAHMNEDHKDALSRYGKHYLSIESQEWNLTGIDVRGMDLMLDACVYRINFPETITNSAQLRKILANM